jgi:hypothetical protein
LVVLNGTSARLEAPFSTTSTARQVEGAATDSGASAKTKWNECQANSMVYKHVAAKSHFPLGRAGNDTPPAASRPPNERAVDKRAAAVTVFGSTSRATAASSSA